MPPWSGARYLDQFGKTKVLHVPTPSSLGQPPVRTEVECRRLLPAPWPNTMVGPHAVSLVLSHGWTQLWCISCSCVWCQRDRGGSEQQIREREEEEDVVGEIRRKMIKEREERAGLHNFFFRRPPPFNFFCSRSQRIKMSNRFLTIFWYRWF
jgi:hypothetical protein